MARAHRARALAVSLFASLQLLSCTNQKIPHSDSQNGLWENLSIGAYERGVSNTILDTLRTTWPARSRSPNYGNMGLRPLLFLDRQEPSRLNHLRDETAERLIFANFGPFGFLMSELREGSNAKKKRYSHYFSGVAAIFAAGALIKSPEDLTDEEAESTHRIPQGVAPEAQAVFFGSEKSTAHRCVSLGFHTDPEIYRYSHTRGATCLFHRAVVDERFPNGEIRSKILCLHKQKGLILETQLDHAQLVIPSADRENLLVFEGSFAPAHVTRINLDTLDMVSIAQPETKQPSAFASNSPLRQEMRFPEAALGLYRCSNSLLYFDAEVYLARRNIDPTQERIWVLKEHQTKGIEASESDWNTLRNTFPDLLVPAPSTCAFHEAPDFRCALTMMPIAMRLFDLLRTAALADQFPNPTVQRDLLLLGFTALLRIQNALPNWLLERDADILMTVFAQGIDHLERLGVPPLREISNLVGNYLRSGPVAYPEREKEEQDAFLKLMPQISTEQWNGLKATVQNDSSRK